MRQYRPVYLKGLIGARDPQLVDQHEIQTGNLAIDGAKNFGRFEAFFLPTAQWEQVREFILLRNGAANWLSPVCRTSAVCSKRALFTAGLAGSAHGRGGIG